MSRPGSSQGSGPTSDPARGATGEARDSSETHDPGEAHDAGAAHGTGEARESADAAAEDDKHPADERYERWRDRLSTPVLIAALASIPAVFLSVLDGAAETAGSVINTVSGAVLVAETVVLASLSRDRRAWVREHRWLLGFTLLLIPAVLLAVGPVQLLRLVRVVGALRFLRVRRIFRAAKLLRERAGLTGWASRGLTFVAALLVAAFVAVVLSDPTSRSRQLAEDAVERLGGTPLVVLLVVVAGLLLAGATFVVARSRRDDG